HRPSVAVFNHLQLRKESRGVLRRVAAVNAVSDERFGNAGRRTGSGQPNPQIPIFTEAISSIEGGRRQNLLADNHTGTTASDRIDAVDRLGHLFRWLWRRTPDDPMFFSDVDRSGVRPASTGGSERLELEKKF